MQRTSGTAFTALAAAVLLSGCGWDGTAAFDAGRSPGKDSGPLLVDQPLPEWHPALPEGHPPLYRGESALPEGHPPVLPDGHPPVSRGECPAAGMDGLGVLPGSAGSEQGTIST